MMAAQDMRHYQQLTFDFELIVLPRKIIFTPSILLMSSKAAMDRVDAFDDPQEPSVIRDFLNQYDFGYYEQLAETVSNTCKDFFKNSECDANVTHRAKTKESLRKKLRRDFPKHQYKDNDDICRKVADLSGVRIALFFPQDKERIDSFLKTTFNVKEIIPHPTPDQKAQIAARIAGGETIGNEPAEESYEKQFKGYQATHYRVQLRPENHSRHYHHGDLMEIQVTSVLQYAWSEVEHNILYKHLKGKPSAEENLMLDGLNGLVSIGELYVMQLNQIYLTRMAIEKDQNKPFPHKYELGSFLFSRMQELKVPVDDIAMSSVELLRKMLQLDSVGQNSKFKFGQKIDAIRNWESSLSPRHVGSGMTNPSIVVMEHLLKDPTLRLEEKAQNYKPESERRRCKILMSTVISLDELFSPESFWAIELTRYYDEYKDEFRQHSKNFEWLMNNQAPKNIILDKNKKVRPSDEYGRKLGNLWNWFQEHPSPFVKFAFNISKLGVLRDFPQEFPLLKRIYFASKSYMTTN